jgi:hypothetical protein
MYKKAAKFYNRFKAQTGKEPSSIAKPLTSKPDRHKDLDQIRNASSAVSRQAALEKEGLINDQRINSERPREKMKLFSDRFKARRAETHAKSLGKKNIDQPDHCKRRKNLARRRAQLNKVVFRRKPWTVH